MWSLTIVTSGELPRKGVHRFPRVAMTHGGPGVSRHILACASTWIFQTSHWSRRRDGSLSACPSTWRQVSTRLGIDLNTLLMSAIMSHWLSFILAGRSLPNARWRALLPSQAMVTEPEGRWKDRNVARISVKIANNPASSLR